MPLKWIAQPVTPPPSPAPEAPKIVLATPGSVTPGSPAARRWMLHALAAGSVALVAFKPLPRPSASTFTVTDLLPSGPGSLRAAIDNANAHPGPDIVNFQPGLVGTIPITTQLAITDSIQIVGPGPGALSVSGSNQTRVFYLYSSSLFTSTISGLTIRDGNPTSKYGGGGILDVGQPLTLDNVHVVSNTANSNDGGGVDIEPRGPNQGALTVQHSVISGNHGNNGGGISASKLPQAMLIQDTQIMSNTAVKAGGGLNLYYSAGELTIQASTITSNTAGDSGGGLNLYYSAGGLTIQVSTITSNTAGASGGGLDINVPSGDVLIEDSTIVSNSASYGGGVELAQSKGGQQTVRRTTITGNTAQIGGGLDIYDMTTPVLVENSTISGNHASETGGGVHLYDHEPATIRNSTIVSNTAVQVGGGVAVRVGSLPITDTIIAGNLAPLGRDISGTFQLKYDLVQVTGTATISNAGGNVFGLDPLLGPLALNGGPTKTHLLLHGSPAIDAGDPAFAPPPTTDQRGDPRVVHGRLDIGAVETALEEVKLFLPLVRR